MRFTYQFHPRGVHQIIILLWCMSPKAGVIRLNPNDSHYIKNSFKPLKTTATNTRCLDIHTYLGACKQFRIQLFGAARGSRLVITNVNFYKQCCKF